MCLHDYADDNTGGVSRKSAEDVCLKLSNLINTGQGMLPWFTEKVIQANPTKFKFVVFSKTTLLCDIKIIERVM